MMKSCRQRDIAKIVAGTLFCAIVCDSVALFLASEMRMVSPNSVWEAFLLLGLSLGLAFPRMVLRILLLLAGLACLAGILGQGPGITVGATGFLGFAIAVAVNRWVDGLPLLPGLFGASDDGHSSGRRIR